MNWEAVGAIGEITGAFGVIVTLLYLALQIRSNNNMLRSAKYNELISEFRNMALENSKHPQDIEILLKAAESGFDSLTPVQQVRWAALIFSQLATFENAFHADRNGVADPELWKSARIALVESIARDNNIEQFLAYTESHTLSFREELQGIIRSVKDNN